MLIGSLISLCIAIVIIIYDMLNTFVAFRRAHSCYHVVCAIISIAILLLIYNILGLECTHA